MTEDEWLAATNPDELVFHLGEKQSRRKARLLACACCRRMGELIPEQTRPILDTAERYADREAKKYELPSHIKQLQRLDNRADRAVLLVAYKHGSLGTLRLAVSEARWVLAANGQGRHFGEPLAAESTVQARLVRDIFGNPFRPVVVEPLWLTSTVLALATGIYQEKAFDGMPILADALQDAGCDSDDVLNHCRQPGEHVRGCWVVDLLLGKS